MKAFCISIIFLSLVGCASKTNTTTPTVPDPPQITVMKLVQVGAALDNTAAHTLVALCNSSKPLLDQGTCHEVKQYLTVAVGVFEQITAEVSSQDTWPVMRVKIAGIGATATINIAISDPELRSQVASLQSLITQILGIVQPDSTYTPTHLEVK